MTDNDRIARSFKALAHPRRAAIFQLLATHPRHAADYQFIEMQTGLRPSSLVHHLREMERCGLLRRRRTGPTMTYMLTPGDMLRCTNTARALATQGRPAAA
ncbi:helix-turn-helix domain-containing protein [Maritimibacter sp. DP07]|uniref:Helix-turn-helix domain-containing protein n=1 Tax=Maritimibacter harenae TaxID=2606218 RepID=A0A845M7K6_9RHOB|nr:winged helix-turn-helix domain-containing protein [Maritimibacter harenae]MZR14618.1 helix-turn-helix domain-containing protein [Maritimibacter harenae]